MQRVREETKQRRLEMLKQLSLGFDKTEVLKTLAKKYQKSMQTMYVDYNTMATWAPIVTALDDGKGITYVILQGLKGLIPRAWDTYTKAATNAERIGAIREMRAIMLDILKILVAVGKVEKVYDKGFESDADLSELLKNFDAIFQEEATQGSVSEDSFAEPVHPTTPPQKDKSETS